MSEDRINRVPAVPRVSSAQLRGRVTGDDEGSPTRVAGRKPSRQA